VQEQAGIHYQKIDLELQVTFRQLVGAPREAQSLNLGYVVALSSFSDEFETVRELQSPNHLGRLPKTVRTARHACVRTGENSALYCCLAIRSTSFFSRLIPTRVPLVTRDSVALPIPIT
jgi:hypothetical protein